VFIAIKLVTVQFSSCSICLVRTHRHSQDFVWGALFLAQKVDNLFFSRRPQRLSRNIPPNLTSPAKTVLKIDSYSRWGALRVLGCTYTFSL